ncbi:MAG: DUF3148 domain-containing protein [Leptolyngbyaceae bacterium]|nr:DUF3148 domain-containing protein [Leptolyngbyaceae bacterium]
MAETNKPDGQDETTDASTNTHTTESEDPTTANNALPIQPPPPHHFTVGDRVCISKQPPYFKTADTMPMLRPPDTIPVGTEGRIMGSSPGGYWIVRFPNGSFLMDSQYIQAMS